MLSIDNAYREPERSAWPGMPTICRYLGLSCGDSHLPRGIAFELTDLPRFPTHAFDHDSRYCFVKFNSTALFLCCNLANRWRLQLSPFFVHLVGGAQDLTALICVFLSYRYFRHA
jgi:hypothetical protein